MKCCAYHRYARCGACRHDFCADAANLRALAQVCPFCGERYRWETVIKRWISLSVWYKPWTWWTGRYEERPQTPQDKKPV